MTKLVTLSAAIEKQLCITLKKSRNFVKKTTVKFQKLIIALDLMNYKLPNRVLSLSQTKNGSDINKAYT